MERRELKRFLIIGIIIIGICAVVKNFSLIGELITLIFSALYPLLLGGAIAFVFNIFLSFCERYYFPKKKTGFAAYSRRPVCLVFSIAFVVAAIVLLIYVIVPEFTKSIKLIINEIPGIAESIKDWALNKSADLPDIQNKIAEMDVDWASLVKSTANFVTVGAGGFISGVADVIGAFTLSVTRIVIAVIFAVYILICKDGIKLGFRRAADVYLNEKVRGKVEHIFCTANKTFKKFFIGQFTEALILGSLCAIGMLVLKLPYAVMTGTVVGVTAIIPIVGAYIGAALGAFMILTENPMQALIFLIFLVILQQIEGNFIYPRVVGSSIGLPGIWVLAAVTVGGSLFGITGMLLGVPILATIYKLVYEDIANREAILHPQLDIIDNADESNNKNEKNSDKTNKNSKSKNNGKNIFGGKRKNK